MGKRRILVIDDDPDFLTYVSIVLQSGGYEVRTAPVARAGLEIMRSWIPHLVIADVMMSYGLDGWSVGHVMKTEAGLRDVPLIMVSAVVTPQDLADHPEFCDGCVATFMSKPVEPHVLLERVAELVTPQKENAP